MLRKGAWTVRIGVMPVVMFIVLAIFGTAVVYWIYGRAQELIDISVLSILLCTIPVFAVVFAYAILSEPMTAQLVAGGAVILAGIVMIATERKPAAEAPEPFH
jgi:drug/metabolite transporter (DMT)-like permease